LRDPRWQKLRLRCLERSEWKCEHCDSGEKTLHVHHKRYIKGRKPWEYDADQLEVLCESCHEDTHKLKETLDEIFATTDSFQRPDIVSIVGGYLDGWGFLDDDIAEKTKIDKGGFWLGSIAALIGSSSGAVCEEILSKLVAQPNVVAENARAACQEWLDFIVSKKGLGG
jgi:hypothetical protein